jgi:hypothetical protein
MASCAELAPVLPQYLRDDPRLAPAQDEAGADDLGGVLDSATLGGLIEAKELTSTRPPTALPEDTLIEVASVMDGGLLPLVLVEDRDGHYLGVNTMSRVLAAVATAAGRHGELVRRRLERDLFPCDPA